MQNLIKFRSRKLQFCTSVSTQQRKVYEAEDLETEEKSTMPRWHLQESNIILSIMNSLHQVDNEEIAMLIKCDSCLSKEVWRCSSLTLVSISLSQASQHLSRLILCCLSSIRTLFTFLLLKNFILFAKLYLLNGFTFIFFIVLKKTIDIIVS